jgi:bacterioferritin-associated ferredoxin
MYVCICNGITENQIRDAISDGVRSLRELRADLGVASCCGKCADCAQQVIHETLSTAEFRELSAA